MLKSQTPSVLKIRGSSCFSHVDGGATPLPRRYRSVALPNARAKLVDIDLPTHVSILITTGCVCASRSFKFRCLLFYPVGHEDRRPRRRPKTGATYPLLMLRILRWRSVLKCRGTAAALAFSSLTSLGCALQFHALVLEPGEQARCSRMIHNAAKVRTLATAQEWPN